MIELSRSLYLMNHEEEKSLARNRRKVRTVNTERVLAMTLALREQTDAKGNRVQDAFLAAHAMEHGCVWITTDRDFSRFPALTWRLPGE
jgi:predicted nucleic acid-binding protein